MLEVGFFFFD